MLDNCIKRLEYWHSIHNSSCRHRLLSCSVCCSNHSLLKDKWSYNKQSSPMGYQVKSGGITKELDKEPSLHCFSIYINTMWSMLQQCVYLMSIHHASTLRLPCFLHVPWYHTFNLHCICAHHVYTMRNHSPLTSYLTLTPSRLFPILLDHSSCYHMTSRSCALHPL